MIVIDYHYFHIRKHLSANVVISGGLLFFVIGIIVTHTQTHYTAYYQEPPCIHPSSNPKKT
jgi:hypothetical protein